MESDGSRSTVWELVRPASTPRDVWNRASVTVASADPVKLFFQANGTIKNQR